MPRHTIGSATLWSQLALTGAASTLTPGRSALADGHFNVVELCAGAGGQSFGLHLAGFAHHALVEVDPDACDTLRTNGALLGFSDRVHEADVAWWPDNGLVPGLESPSLLAAGVPCPPFSEAGLQHGPADARDLFPRLLELIELLAPRAVLVENVRGLMTKRFDSYRAQIDRALRPAYEPDWRVLRACDFGVAQVRPRTVLVALRPDDARQFKWPEPTLGPPTTVGKLLGSSMASLGWEGATAWAEAADGVAPTIVGGSKRHGGPDLGPTRARVRWAELGVDGRSVADAVPGPGFVGMPRLTVAQAALVQGFPDWWQFAGGKTSRYRQVGNAFPPPVAMAVGNAIRHAFEMSDAVESRLEEPDGGVVVSSDDDAAVDEADEELACRLG